MGNVEWFVVALGIGLVCWIWGYTEGRRTGWIKGWGAKQKPVIHANMVPSENIDDTSGFTMDDADRYRQRIEAARKVVADRRRTL
jgi:hypothetical protein